MWKPPLARLLFDRTGPAPSSSFHSRNAFSIIVFVTGRVFRIRGSPRPDSGVLLFGYWERRGAVTPPYELIIAYKQLWRRAPRGANYGGSVATPCIHAILTARHWDLRQPMIVFMLHFYRTFFCPIMLLSCPSCKKLSTSRMSSIIFRQGCHLAYPSHPA
jgi:hypothetical protein